MLILHLNNSLFTLAITFCFVSLSLSLSLALSVIHNLHTTDIQSYFYKDAKDLITSLLVITPKSRLTARETLAHPWVFGSGLPNLSEEFEKRRLDYLNELEKKHNEFKQSMNEKNPIDLFDKNNTNKDHINQNIKLNDIKKLELPRITKIKELHN